MCQAVIENDQERSTIIKLSECFEKERALGEESKWAKVLSEEDVTVENLEPVTTVEILASYVNQDPHDTLLIYDYPRNNEDVEGAYHARSSTHGYIVAFCIFTPVVSPSPQLIRTQIGIVFPTSIRISYFSTYLMRVVWRSSKMTMTKNANE